MVALNPACLPFLKIRPLPENMFADAVALAANRCTILSGSGIQASQASHCTTTPVGNGASGV